VAFCLSGGERKPGSPLNGRLVFQIRGLRRDGKALVPVILSHTGRALSREQQERDGKYWSYPFRKGLEIYNQDQLLLDKEAREQAGKFGLILVEGFFDAAKLVAADCRNVGALMGSSISAQQVERLVWMQSLLKPPYIRLFMDRDAAGQQACRKLQKRLEDHNLPVTVFDWNLKVSLDGKPAGQIPESIQDPADMSLDQLRALRRQQML